MSGLDLMEGRGVAASVPAAGRGPAQQVLGWLLAGVLAGAGAMAGTVGAGLALLGVCCAGPAVTVGTAAAATAAGVVVGVYSKSFLVVAALLGLAAFVVYRRLVHRPSCAQKSCPSTTGAAAGGLQPRRESSSSEARS